MFLWSLSQKGKKCFSTCRMSKEHPEERQGEQKRSGFGIRVPRGVWILSPSPRLHAVLCLRIRWCFARVLHGRLDVQVSATSIFRILIYRTKRKRGPNDSSLCRKYCCRQDLPRIVSMNKGIIDWEDTRTRASRILDKLGLIWAEISSAVDWNATE